MPTETWTTVGSHQWTVPSGVESITARCWGGDGGSHSSAIKGTPGTGGYAETTDISVTPGETLNIYVAGGGGTPAGGFNGGGDSETDNESGGGGGGASDIRQGGDALSDRIIIAGGGGGAGGAYDNASYDFQAGDGGDAGQDGGDGYDEFGDGTQEGGHDGSGGSGGTGGSGYSDNGDDGGGLTGGTGGLAANPGGGGGGGYGGGGGGGAANNGSAGGGGGGQLGGTTAVATGSYSISNGGDGRVEIEYQKQPAPPDNVSATVDADDQISLSWDKDTSDGAPSDYDIHISRDGGSWSDPSGGPSNVTDDGSSSYTATYGPSSDTAYGRQVGIDSSFQFRVRANNGAGSSDWTSSGTVYTSPIPPHNPSVSRPDGDTIELSIALNTDILHFIRVQYRVDTGNGYGSWDDFDNITSGEQTTGTWSKGSTITREYSVGSSYQYGHTLQSDARYQFRLRMGNNNGPTLKWSDWVYADYGNEGNVYFEDDFESGDFSAWDTVSQDALVESDSGPDSGFSGADEGTYYVQLDNSGTIIKNLGDLSGESDVIVKCAMAAGSLDNSSETAQLAWYDGDGWNALKELFWEYNEQGWVEVTALVPSSWLSTDNRVRFAQYGGDGDYTYVDRVVVSDVLHEYTTPATPSGLSLDTSVDQGITASWTDNTAFLEAFDTDYQRTSASSWTNHDNVDGTQTTISGLLDGEEYAIRTRAFVNQPRHGAAASTNFTSSYISTSAVTNLPAPTGLSVDAITATSVDLSWTDNHNYGETRVEFKQSDAGSWTTFITVSRNTEAETITALLHGEQYDARVVAETEHTETEDA